MIELAVYRIRQARMLSDAIGGSEEFSQCEAGGVSIDAS